MPQDDDTLYRFLTVKLKEHGLPVESLPSLLGISRSTLYRNMKGTVRMSTEVQARFVDLLNLSLDEQQDFDRLSSLASFDPTLVEARHVLDRFVFGNASASAKPETIRFAYYDNESYLRTSTQIYESILKLAMADDAKTTVQIINCTTDRTFRSIASFAGDLLTQNDTAIVEHLLTLPNNDYAEMGTVVTRLVPLLQFKRYTVHYAEIPSTDVRSTDGSAQSTWSTARTILGNSMDVEIQDPDGPVFFLLSFFDADLSACLVTRDASMIAFFHDNYNATKNGYSEALVNSANPSLFNDSIAQLEQGRNVCLIKPNFCFDRIPITVFESMLSSLSPSELAHIQFEVAGVDDDHTAVLDMALSTLDRRERNSHANRHTDVCSVKGLTDLARTGRLSDHLNFLPPFSPSERRTIFSNVQARFNDPDDPYTLYVTRDDVFPSGYLAFAIEGVGLILQYDEDSNRRGDCNNLFIANAALAEIFSDFATNHIPQARALTREDTNALLTSLIESIGNA